MSHPTDAKATRMMTSTLQNIPALQEKSSRYALNVKRDSMIDAGIFDNDLVGVRKTRNAENGEIVVARLDNEVTLKRFKKDSSGIKLVAENKSFSDIAVDESLDFSIEGKAVGIIRENL